MLKRNGQMISEEANHGIWGAPSVEPFAYFSNVIRRRLSLFFALMTMSIVLAVIYLFNTAPIYVATASMAIDVDQVKSLEPRAGNELVVDSGLIQTQIEILKSQSVSRSVIKQLRLTEDPEFIGNGPGLKELISKFLSGLFGGDRRSNAHAEVPNAQAPESLMARQVLDTFQNRRSVTRVGQSYVMDISVQSTNPEKAARIANAIADAYIKDQLEAKYAATRRASDWLQERMQELQVQAAAQQRAVVQFREKNNIVDVAGGRLLNDQQLSELDSQLILAQAATAQAKARYYRLREIMTENVPDASVADVFQNQTIIKLRGQYLDLTAREAIWEEKYGPNHLAVLNLRRQIQEILRSIQDEMRKIEESYKSDYEIAQAREQSLSKSVGAVVSQSQTTNLAQIQLGELQSRAQTSKMLHDNFLQRNLEAVQQQSFPITEARLISPAETPLSKSYPKTSLVLLLATVGGLAASIGVAFLCELSERAFRSSRQVEEALQVNCVALLPRLKPAEASMKVALSGSDKSLRADSRTMLDHVLLEPFSQFSEALRTVKLASDLNSISKSTKVIGITSTLPNEGKSTISANYAQLIADAGSRVVLIDGDLRNPSLSRQLAAGHPGLIDVLIGSKDIDDVLLVDQRSELRFFPSGPKRKIPHTNELLASDKMKWLIDALRDGYDYIVIDLSPLIPVVDARATTNFVDSYIYVVEWGRTRIDVTMQGLSGAPELYSRLLGVVMNKVDMTVIGKYDRHQTINFHEKYHAQYGDSG